MNAISFIPLLLALMLSPLLLRRHQPHQGVVCRTTRSAAAPNLFRFVEAAAKGRGLQPHHDLDISRRADGWAGGGNDGGDCWCRWGMSRRSLAFPADFLLFAGLLGLMRFFTVVAALDTGSSFEGMGASREVFFLRADRTGFVCRAGDAGATNRAAFALNDV